MRRVMLSVLLLTSASAFAQDTALLHCADIAGRDERLACFDALAAKARTAKAMAATPLGQADKFGRETVPVKPAEKVADKVAEKSADKPAEKQSEVIDAVKSHIDGIVEGWTAGTVFTLANGQRWQVADGSAATIYLKSPKVTVKRAMLGGYVIELEGTNRTAKVKRVE